MRVLRCTFLPCQEMKALPSLRSQQGEFLFGLSLRLAPWRMEDGLLQAAQEPAVAAFRQRFARGDGLSAVSVWF